MNDHRYGGLGLGLAISKTIVELHGGKIEASSEGINQGATFRVSFGPLIPAPQPVTAAPTVRRNRDSAVAPLRLLLVEDHLPTRSVMERLLKRRGHSVTTAENVASALAAAEDNGGKFDAVICDLGLPDGSGHDLMAQLRDEYGLRGIAVSGYGMEEDVRRSTDSGFSAHLTKPIEFKELRDALALVLPAVRRQQRRRCLREPLFTLRGRALRRGGAYTPAAGSGFRSAHGKPFVGQIIWSPRPPNINRRHGDVAVRRGFCSTCGSPIFWDSVQKDWIGIAMGAFDLPTDTKLGIHVFVAEKGDYYDIADGLPQHQWTPSRSPGL